MLEVLSTVQVWSIVHSVSIRVPGILEKSLAWFKSSEVLVIIQLFCVHQSGFLAFLSSYVLPFHQPFHQVGYNLLSHGNRFLKNNEYCLIITIITYLKMF